MTSHEWPQMQSLKNVSAFLPSKFYNFKTSYFMRVCATLYKSKLSYKYVIKKFDIRYLDLRYLYIRKKWTNKAILWRQVSFFFSFLSALIDSFLSILNFATKNMTFFLIFQIFPNSSYHLGCQDAIEISTLNFGFYEYKFIFL